MNKITLLFTILIFYNNINAQYEYIATEMGLNTLQGSARYVATGGVMGSVGAELGTVITNPAATGMFSRGELSFTPTIQINNAGTEYIQFDTKTNGRASSAMDDIKLKFSMGNFSGVIANRLADGNVLVGSNVAISLTRTHDFNRKFSFAANHPAASWAQSSAEYLTKGYKIDPANFPISRSISDQDFYDYGEREINSGAVGLLYANTADTSIGSYASNDVQQQGEKNIWGGINELGLTWGGNIKDRVYIGAGLGVPIMNMTIHTLFSEDHLGDNSKLIPNSSLGYFRRHSFEEEIAYSGAGINLKLGVLGKLHKNIRLGAFFHSPSYMSIKETYKIKSTSNFTNSFSSNTFEGGEYSFSMITPMKIGGGACVISKLGFISAEYEYNTMSTSRFFFDGSPANEVTLNNIMKNDRLNTHTFKLGAELVMLKKIRLRGGYNIRTTPYTALSSQLENAPQIVENADIKAQTLTFGVGYRGDVTSIDLAFMNTQYNEYNSFYTANNRYNYGIKNNFVRQHILITANIRFAK